MIKEIFHHMFRATLVGVSLLTLLALAPGGVHHVKAQDGPVMPANDERALPKSISLQREASPLALATALPSSNAPGYYDTSTYMLGSVSVGIILPESNGNGENWTTTEKNQVVAEIQNGLDWWKNRGGTLANLSFQYDLQLGIPTTYEPIARPSSDEGLWINDSMSKLGYNDGNYFDNVYAYVNDLRAQYHTDWAFAIFVVDSSNDVDGKFTDGYFAYAYLSGPFMVMTYDNDGWGIDNMNWITSHETGHIFMAGDQYYQAAYGGCTSTTKRYGYLGVPNANCQFNNPGSVPSIMRDNSDALDVYARGQIGWRDSDSDGIPDPMDTTPTVNLSPHSPNPTSETSLFYSGYALDSPYPHANCSTGEACYDKDVTTQAIDKVEYRLDNGAWNSAVASDGSFDSDVESFSFNSALSAPGSYPVQVRSSNRAGNVSAPWNDTVMTSALPAASVGTGIYDDSDSNWVYTGDWTAYTGSGPYSDTMHYSSTIGDFATLDFQGNQFILTYTANFNRGDLEIYVDGDLVTTLNEYKSTADWQSTWTSPHFTNAAHTLKLVHASGTYVDIDAIQITQVTPLGSGIYDDTHSSWAYVGDWFTYVGSGPSSNTMHYSATPGNYATLVFQGVRFILTHTAYTTRGQIQVYVDGNLEGTLDEYNPTLVWQKTTSGPSVTDGTHVLKLVHATGAYVDIDAIQIIAPLGPGTYDDTHNAWVYTGDWTAYTGSGPANNTMHYSSTIGDFATLDFHGNQFILTHTANFNRGQVQVFVDGTLEGTLDEYNATVIWQKTTNGPIVTNGKHILKLVHSTGTYIDIDAIQIIAPPDTTPPAPIDTLVAAPGTLFASVDLSWTAVGDDGTTGTASSYEVRYRLNAPINDEASWLLATPVLTGIPTPRAAGQAESMTVSSLTPGQTYYFAVRAQDEVPQLGAVSTSTGNSSAQPFAPLPPPNDDFATATTAGAITSMPYTDTNDYFYAATTEAGDPAISQCDSDQGKYSIWYSYTPTSDGILVADTYGTNLAYDTVLAVWTVNGSNFTHVACNDDANENTFLSQVVAYLYGGTTYYIEIVQYKNPPPQPSPSASGPLPAAPIDEVVLNATFNQAAIKGLGKHDDSDPDWVYTGDWTAYTGSGPYSDTMHYSSTIGDFAALAFQGPQFKLTYTGYTNRGGMDIYVDNAKVGTLNEYNTTLAWQSTWTSPPFTDAIHTLKLVHASGTFVDIDAIQITPVTPLGPGTYEDTLSNWAYIGDWFTYVGSGPSGNTMHYSATIGDYAALAFQGTRFILTHTGFTNRGQIQVYVDGNLEGTLDENNPTLVWQKTASGPYVSDGTHVLKLVHATGAYIDIDAIQIIASLGPGTYDDTHNAWIYTGDWTAYTGSGPANNTMHYSATTGDYATLAFEGNGFILTHTGYTNRGQVQVFVDDNPEGTLDEYNSTLVWQKTTNGPIVTNGKHILKLVHSSGAFIDIDAIQIIGTLVPIGAGTYDDTHSAWTYTGNWTAYTGSGPVNSTMHYSSTIGDFARLNFQGTQFVLTYTGYTNRGQVQVFIDNNPVGTLDEYNPSLVWQKTANGPTVTNGTHTLRLVHASGTYIDIDAIQIIAP